jgi:hypothetical protein
MPRSIRREHARLSQVFQRLLLLSVGAPLGTLACSSSSPPAAAGPGADANADAPAVTDAAEPDAGAPDGGAADGPGACFPGPHYDTDASYVAVVSDAGGDAGDAAALAHCWFFVDLPCGASFPQSSCDLQLADCVSICGGGIAGCDYAPSTCVDGGLVAAPPARATVACGICGGAGRRPAGLAEPCLSPAATATGDYFARVAHLEAASVTAFLRLRDDLEALGAPAELVDAAGRAARDEIAHARLTSRIARRYGGEAPAPRVSARRARRTPASLARENAVEGCVRETFAALVAARQAEHAADPAVRAALRRIARDEARHAALAWAVARWVEPRLGAGARRRLARATRDAIAALRDEVLAPVDAGVVRDAGVPRPALAARLVDALATDLWAA